MWKRPQLLVAATWQLVRNPGHVEEGVFFALQHAHSHTPRAVVPIVVACLVFRL